MTYQEWIKRHEDHFQEYQAWEVARVALACGFSMSDMAADVTEWVTRSQRRLRLWQSPFFLKWLQVASYERGTNSND